jgi:RimJ/RimL family protein N-acetyltransferase
MPRADTVHTSDMANPMPRFAPMRDDAIELRALEPSDVALTTAWRNDPAIRDQVLSFRFPVSHVMEARFIERAIAGEGTAQCVVGIVDLSDGALCGLVYLRDIDWISRHAAFGMMIGRRDRQRRGFGRRALRLMLAYGFDVLNLERIYLFVADYNTAGRRLYETAGFSHEGRLRQHVALEGKYHDLLVMGLLREEYAQARERNADRTR